MGALNQHWYSINEGTSYPIDESATIVDDTGVLLLPGVVIDLRLRWPDYLGQYAYIGSIHVSKAIVTVTILATSDLHDPSSATPLAVVSVVRPATLRRQYQLVPQAPGVGGWIVFGTGADSATPYTARFSTAAQSLLTARAARKYKAPPVTSVRAYGAGKLLTGLVRLRGDSPVEVVKAQRDINGVPTDVIVVRMVDTSQNTNRAESGGASPPSTFLQYAGPCGGRPESGTCATPPIEFINSVGPDCNGQITFRFTGYVSVAQLGGAPGVLLSSPIGLDGACPAAVLPDSLGNLPSNGHLSSPALSFPEPLNFASLSTYSSPEVVGTTGSLPLTVDLTATIGSFAPISGLWSSGGYYGCASLIGLNLAHHPLTDTGTVYRKVTARLILPDQASGSQSQAGLLLNYRAGVMDPAQHVYYVAYLDKLNQRLVISRFNGSLLSIVSSVFVPNLHYNEFYQIEVTVLPDGNPTYTKIHAVITGITTPGVNAVLDVFVNDYRPSVGSFGLFANRTVAHFSLFKVEVALA